MITKRHSFTCQSVILALALVLALPLCFVFAEDLAVAEPSPVRLAFLGVRLQNDNEGLEPTTDAERNRVAMLGRQFSSALARLRKIHDHAVDR